MPRLRRWSRSSRPRASARRSTTSSAGWSSIRQPDTEEVRMGPWETVRVELDDGIAWVELNRPEKRNAMNPRLNAEMVDVLLRLDEADEVGVLVLTGAGDAFS